MPTATEPQLLTFRDWTFRYRMAQPKPGRFLILLHGWMGDENSMWVLARKLSLKYEIIAPRGPFTASEGGFSWREIKTGTWGMPSFEDLCPVADSLLAFMTDWSTSVGIDVRQFDLMGFSQGAALVYTLTLLHPDRVGRVVALSGFFPRGGEVLLTPQKFSGKLIFVTHGRQDKLISVEAGRKAVTLLESVGAQVTYCESDAGHKVSRDCLNEMGLFMGKF